MEEEPCIILLADRIQRKPETGTYHPAQLPVPKSPSVLPLFSYGITLTKQRKKTRTGTKGGKRNATHQL
jgi:hypothetical protein